MINNNIKHMRSIQVQLDMKVPGSPLVQVIHFGGVVSNPPGGFQGTRFLCFLGANLF